MLYCDHPGDKWDASDITWDLLRELDTEPLAKGQAQWAHPRERCDVCAWHCRIGGISTRGGSGLKTGMWCKRNWNQVPNRALCRSWRGKDGESGQKLNSWSLRTLKTQILSRLAPPSSVPAPAYQWQGRCGEMSFLDHTIWTFKILVDTAQLPPGMTVPLDSPASCDNASRLVPWQEILSKDIFTTLIGKN